MKSITTYLKSITEAKDWHEDVEVIENLGWLSRELVQLRNQVHRFSSQPFDSNQHPTTDRLVDQALGDISGVGIVLFENLTVLSALAKTIARELWGYADEEIRGPEGQVDNAEFGLKQLDVVPENAIDAIDLHSRDEYQWFLYHLREKLDTIDSDSWRIMSVFDTLG